MVTNNMKKTVVIGATPNPTRYAYIASHDLVDSGHEIVPIGIKKGMVAGEEILDLRNKPVIEGVDTVTMYIGTRHQDEWIDYIIDLKPKRIIFNPGTENPMFYEKAKANNIEVVPACTLVMLSVGIY